MYATASSRDVLNTTVTCLKRPWKYLWKMTKVLLPSPLKLGNSHHWHSQLKCRLERMERRMSLLRHKGSTPEHQREPALDVQNAKSAPPASTCRLDDQAPSRGIKRKHSLEPVNLNRRFGQVGRPPKDRSNPSKVKLQPERTHSLRDRTSSTPKKQYTPSVPSDEDCYDSTPQKPRIRRARKQNEALEAERAAQERLRRIQSLAIKTNGHSNSNLLRTDSYYVPFVEYVHVGEISPIKQKMPEPVKVPTWRVHTVPTGYSMEGTENLDDEIFAKRHQKPEQEERRRKRWDLQRMREQQMHSRLEHKQQHAYPHKKHSDNSAQEFLSFLPDPDRVKYIEVCEKVPVSAFGFPIPIIKPMEFELPWGDMEQREREERTKSCRGKRR